MRYNIITGDSVINYSYSMRQILKLESELWSFLDRQTHVYVVMVKKDDGKATVFSTDPKKNSFGDRVVRLFLVEEDAIKYKEDIVNDAKSMPVIRNVEKSVLLGQLWGAAASSKAIDDVKFVVSSIGYNNELVELEPFWSIRQN